ncbi:MAG TPA: hydantoinase/carbamoylase family amidase [Solirubrobacteraceae bacterium]|nr:hydantoinase/carbamoylase family amidase [Solirubrobacteraceae bacterium]
MISGESLAARLRALDEIGVRPDGVYRLAWTDEDAATRAWFERQAADAGLRVERDPAGNLWACPAAPPPWWGIGSHLDSVRGGGRFDGPLGVACAFEIAANSDRPVAVLSFADEEGARFNTPTFGSKALAGRLDLPAVLSRCDDGGMALSDALRAAGVDPDGLSAAPLRLEKLTGFVEIHIDQTTELARAGEPVGIVTSLAARTRLEVLLRGRADHAGTTPRGERRDALAAAARLIVAAEDVSASDPSLTVTTSRIIAKPNAPTTIAAEVRLWIDARAPGGFDAIDTWRARLEEAAAELAARSGVSIDFSVASRSDGREFSPPLRASLARASEQVIGHAAPDLVCFAGHDAGVISERVPSAMLLVRNESGVSHSPAEEVDRADAAIAARVVEQALREVT